MINTVHVIVPTTCHDLGMVWNCVHGILKECPDSVPYLVANTDTEDERRNRDSIARLIPHAKNHIHVPTRLGYVDAVNLGFKRCLEWAATDDYVCVLNDDVIVNGDFIAPLCCTVEAGAAQAGPSIHYVGRNGYWGTGDEPYLFLEGWCWLAKISTILKAASCIEPPEELIYDSVYSPGYCEDCDLSIRIQKLGGEIREVKNVPLLHLRSRTFGRDREPFWTRNREHLVRRWRLKESAVA